jgi:serine/threonine protein kinase
MAQVTGLSSQSGASKPNKVKQTGDRPDPDQLAPAPSPAPDTPSLNQPTLAEQENVGDTPCPGVLPGTFGHYRIIGEVARGGMGVVYRARDLHLGRYVALKTIRGDKSDWSGDLVQRFQREAQSAARLRHPNIVTVFESGTYEGQHYFAMDYMAGGSLAQDRARYQRDPVAAAVMVEKVARAVHFGHTRGILHRDLKPANILLDETGEPHVSDFGLAKPIEAAVDITCSGEVLPGTPAYMAPEQAAGRSKQVGPATDVWALGVILYELLTGTRPFTGESRVEVSDRICHYDPPRPRSVQKKLNATLEAIVLRCLEKEPDKRFASAEILADELGHWRRGEPTLTKAERLPKRILRAIVRRPTTSTAVALSAVILGLVVLLVGAGPGPRAANDQPQPAGEEPLPRAGRFATEKARSLLGDDGMPVNSQWLAGESTLQGDEDSPGTLCFSANKRSLLELAPTVPQAGYRFEAEVKIDEPSDKTYKLCEAGIYFTHSSVVTPQGLENWYCKISFGRHPSVRHAAFQLCRFREVNGLAPELTRANNSVGNRIPIPDTGVSAWYRLRVEVKHGQISTYLGDTPVAILTEEQIPQFARQLLQVTGAPFPPARPECLPLQGGIGLYNCQAQATFRNVKMIPFEP